MDQSRAQEGLDKLARAVVSRTEADTQRRVERAITDAGLVRSSQLNAPIPDNLTGVIDAGSVTTEINAVSVAPSLAGQIADIVTAILGHDHDALYALIGHTHAGSSAPEYVYWPDGTDPDWATDADGHIARWEG